MKKCLIISGGDFCELIINKGSYDLCIACDRGYEYAGRYGLLPDVITGDFDSSPVTDASAEKVLRYPVNKDDTDTMLAVKYALSEGYRDIDVVCAFGGRMDHAFANIQTGAFIVRNGGRAAFFGNGTEARFFGGHEESLILPRREGWSLSVFSISDVTEGVNIKGTKFEAEDVRVENTFPIGVSNVWASEKAEITLKDGILMVMCSELKKGEHI